MGLLGYESLGCGGSHVVVLHDWLGDTSTWDATRPYLNLERFNYIFCDLRGYGRSKGVSGSYSVDEATADVVQLIQDLGVNRPALLGHSMSSLVVVNLAQQYPELLSRVVLVAPPPPQSFKAPEETVQALLGVALGDDAHRTRLCQMMWGSRLHDPWVAYKMKQWRSTSTVEAVAGYVPLFTRSGVIEPEKRIAPPVLLVTGAKDADNVSSRTVKASFEPLCSSLEVVTLESCGHYPMQEVPPLFATVVERFLAPDDDRADGQR